MYRTSSGKGVRVPDKAAARGDAAEYYNTITPVVTLISVRFGVSLLLPSSGAKGVAVRMPDPHAI